MHIVYMWILKKVCTLPGKGGIQCILYMYVQKHCQSRLLAVTAPDIPQLDVPHPLKLSSVWFPKSILTSFPLLRCNTSDPPPSKERWRPRQPDKFIEEMVLRLAMKEVNTIAII